VPYAVPKFSWNRIPGQDDALLLASLKEIFSLEDLHKDHIRVNKTPDNSTVVVTAPLIYIEIKLDLPGSRATATIDIDNKSVRKYEYKIVNLFSEIMACSIRSPEDSIKSAIDSKRLIEVPIYELVSRIGKGSGSEQAVDQNTTILAKDSKFMTLLEEVHNNLHKNFKKGYDQLMQLREKS
ncbi:MAG TPA: hypothetical protein VFI73_08210, partial [Candidatus Nitrosopolaris sp.]|nr:hypothetical protein [Candidatus Nitrosopolaris sp.]